jgi:hypothetical protein
MEIKDVEEIKTTYQSVEANKYLDDGYILLAVAGGIDEEGRPITLYSLGKKKKAAQWTKESLD